MSYEIFPVPLVGPVTTYVNILADGFFFVLLEPLTRFLNPKLDPLPAKTRWEMLTESGPQRRFLQDMTAPELFFQSSYILVRAAIKCSIYGAFAYSVVVAGFAVQRWWFDTDWFWPNYGMPHSGFKGDAERILRDCGDYIEHMWMAGAETRLESHPTPHQTNNEEGELGSHEDQHAAFQAMETMLHYMEKAYKDLPRPKRQQYAEKFRDWRRLAKLGMRLGNAEPPRYPYITQDEALGHKPRNPEEDEIWDMVKDFESSSAPEVAEATPKQRLRRSLLRARAKVAQRMRDKSASASRLAERMTAPVEAADDDDETQDEEEPEADSGADSAEEEGEDGGEGADAEAGAESEDEAEAQAEAEADGDGSADDGSVEEDEGESGGSE